MLKQLDMPKDAVTQDTKKEKSSTKNANSPKKSEVETGMFIFNLLNINFSRYCNINLT